MIIAYCRVSTYEQNLDLQLSAVKQAGAERIYEEKISGAKEYRKVFSQMMDSLRDGDILLVWRLDRLARSLRNLLNIMNELEKKGVQLKSIKESIDTSTASGKLTFSIFAALAEFERDIIRERTLAGLASARSRGKFGGRPKLLSASDEKLLLSLSQDKSIPIKDIISRFHMSRPAYYLYLKRIAAHADNSQVSSD